MAPAATSNPNAGTGKELIRLINLIANTIGETLGSLVSRQIVVRPAAPVIREVAAFAGGLPKACVVARGAMEKGFAGKSFLTAIELGDAIAMVGCLMMTPEETIAARKAKGTLEGEDVQAFGELGKVLYSGIGNVLREQVGNVDVRWQDHAVVKPGLDQSGFLGRDKLLVVPFRLRVGTYPETQGAFALDVATAEAWNKGPLDFATEGASPVNVAAESSTSLKLDDEGLDSIPAAPVRGTLAAFLTNPDLWKTLRRSCRRVGLEVRRHGRGEIPNPAAHKNEVVLLDVPTGEDRRFDWCRRLKELSATTKVVLLVQHPSRQRVTQAFLSRADAILGCPCEELLLSQKLATLLPEDGGETPGDPRAGGGTATPPAGS